MKPNMHTQNRRAPQRGISLVELMIGLVIGLVMTGAISLLFIDASRNHRVNENIARMQESSRFSIDKIGRDARGAGYFGCSGQGKEPDNMLNNKTAYLYRFGTAVEAFIAPDNAWPADLAGTFDTLKAFDDFTNAATATSLRPKAGSQILTLRGVPDGDIIVRSQPGGASIKFSNTNAIKAGDILLVSSCVASAVFQVTQVQDPGANNPFTNVVHNTGGTWVPGNAVNKTDENLVGGEVMRISTTTYFVANNPLTGRPALFRRVGGGNARELARNVDNMQILAGVDTNEDRQIDLFVEDLSTVDWAQVRAVRIVLTLVSEDTGLTNATADGRLQYTTTSTIALRNRLP